MLEVVLEYALESLEKNNETQAIGRSHAMYFLALGEQAEPHLQTAQAGDWLDRLEEEHDNLRAAFRWLLENDAAKAACLAAAIRVYLINHCHLTEGRRRSAAVFEKSDDIPVPARLKLLIGAGQMAYWQGDYQSSRDLFETGLAASREAGDKRHVALASRGLGTAAYQEGDYTAARAFYEESLVVSREAGDDRAIAVSLIALGELTRVEGNYTAARPLYEESLLSFKRVGHRQGVAANLNNLGAVAFVEGDYKTARSYYTEALVTAQELGHKIQISCSLDGFAALAASCGHAELGAWFAGAADSLRESISRESEIADRRFRDAYLSELKTKMDAADFAKAYEQGAN